MRHSNVIHRDKSKCAQVCRLGVTHRFLYSQRKIPITRHSKSPDKRSSKMKRRIQATLYTNCNCTLIGKR